MKSKLQSLCSIIALAVLAPTSCHTAPMAGTGPSFKGPVGLQLYSLRDQFKKDVPGTLDEAKGFGIKYVELAGTYGLTPEQFAKELAKRGIKAVSAHYGFDRFKDDVEGVASEAKALGLEYVSCAWIPHNGDFDEKTCREAAA